MAAGKPKVQSTEDKFKDEVQRFMEMCAVICATEFSDPEHPPQPIARLEGKASRAIAELGRQIHCCCSDKKWTNYQRRVACEQLVKLAFQSTESIYKLAKEFPEPFRQICEELSAFPCLFPAHSEDLQTLQKLMWEQFNLGKRHPLKLRPKPGRKTFSKKTWANQLLLNLILTVYEVAQHEHERDPGEKYTSTFREVAKHVPLAPKNAKEWLDVIWELVLMLYPKPESHPSLRQLVERPSLRTKRMRRDGTVGKRTQAHNVRARIKSKLGEYLKRMLNDSSVTQITT